MTLRILGIETTCDETGIAVVEDGRRILSNRVLSQVPLHERFGGVVPEIASRAHVESITWTLEKALQEAGVEFDGRRPRIDGIAVAYRPGLVGSLLIGVTAAKCLAWAWDLPLVGVDHIHAHIYAGLMTAHRDPAGGDPIEEEDVFPAVSLVVSGGHTALYGSRGWTGHELLGSTIDDAAGEAFDKVSSILKLGYPGGPAISRAAEGGNPKACPFAPTLFEADSLDFSFSGIKTAVLYHVKGQNAGREAPMRAGISIPDVAASFEETVVSTLSKKLERAMNRQQAQAAIVGGGVAANLRLRRELDRLARKEGYRIFYPPPALCTDNGAMIAGLGYRLLQEGRRDSLALDADPVSAR